MSRIFLSPKPFVGLVVLAFAGLLSQPHLRARPSGAASTRCSPVAPRTAEVRAAAEEAYTRFKNDTDWDQILRLYDQLLAVTPSPVVALNRAVAVAEVDGPAVALVLVDGLDLGGYYLFHAIRADLLRRLGRRAEANRRPTNSPSRRTATRPNART